MQTGCTIAEYLSATGETVDSLAERAGVDASTIHRIKSRMVFPSRGTRRRLREASDGQITQFELPADEAPANAQQQAA